MHCCLQIGIWGGGLCLRGIPELTLTSFLGIAESSAASPAVDEEAGAASQTKLGTLRTLLTTTADSQPCTPPTSKDFESGALAAAAMGAGASRDAASCWVTGVSELRGFALASRRLARHWCVRVSYRRLQPLGAILCTRVFCEDSGMKLREPSSV